MTTRAAYRAIRVQPGTPTNLVFSANPGGNAEKMLRLIVDTLNGNHMLTSSKQPERYLVAFKPWTKSADGVETSEGVETTTQRKIQLVIGKKTGLFIQDADITSRSLKYPRNFAKQLFAIHVIHGDNWINRKGKMQKALIHCTFDVIVSSDAAPDAIRTTHVSTWETSDAILSVKAGKLAVLHELNRHEVITHSGCEITSSDTWVGYAPWKGDVRDQMLEKYGTWVLDCPSPFSFLVAVLKQQHGELCTLASSFILKKIGKERLMEALTIIAKNDPGRFSQVIDENGVFHKKSVNATYEYANGMVFTADEVARNVYDTILELEVIELDHCKTLQPKRRLVPDSHFYIVMTALAHHTGGVSHQIPGRSMVRYLTEGEEATTQRIRNARLLRLLYPVFRVSSICLVFQKK